MRRGMAVAVVLLAAGCEKVTHGAMVHVSEANACPMDRLEAKELSLKPSELYVQTHKPIDPPADIASDPQRLAMWTEAQRKDLTSDDWKQLVEVTGCGFVYVMECHHYRSFGPGDKTAWGCSERTKKPIKP